MSLFRPLHHRTLLSHFSRHLLRLQHPFYLKMSFHDYPNIQTPASCYVDFCLVPVGTGNVSVANEVAEVQRLLKASGLKHTMHSAGTTVEGPWDEVMKVIGQAHAVVHQEGAKRVQTSMRAGTRTDKTQTAEDKVKKVEGILSKD
ncbi:YkoF-like protein [Copromyces sp. CBS 386.78]|nr:YkoF-like protein [Copromyces sp. CBS 386.78]